MPSPRQVLILCTGNSCRSQMAEAVWRHLNSPNDAVTSAGVLAAGVNPTARAVIEELGMSMHGQHSKTVASLAGRSFDLVVTVCDHARAVCPAFPEAKARVHWSIPDPAHIADTESDRLDKFRAVRDEIRARISAFLAAESGGEGPP